MRRREALKLAASASLLGLMPVTAQSEEAYRSRLARFERALADRPWLLMVRSTPADELTATATLEGRLPDGLAGTLYRNGPAGFEVGGFRCQHWFDGDGMVQAFRFSDGGVTHHARMVRTYKRRAEHAAGRALYRGFGTSPPDPVPTANADAINTGNISVLPYGDQVLALWEGGSPWIIDPSSLETRGRQVFSPETEGAPFSAHPRTEPDGTVWNFGYASSAGQLVLWQLDRHGRLVRTGLVPCSPMGMPHDFVVTRRHLVLPIPPFHYEPDAEEDTFVSSHRWHPERPTRVLVVDKDDFSRFRWFELPAQWVFHYGNGWEDDAGVIHFDGARHDDPGVMVEGFSRLMKGEPWTASRARHHRYRLDTRRGTAHESPLFDDGLESDFPIIDPRVSCRQNRRLVLLTRDAAHPAGHPMLDTVSLFDHSRDSLTSFRYPDWIIPEEHLFIPATASEPETKGWVIGSALNHRDARTEIRVFDAEALDAGPLVTAALPYALPLGLHGKFVA